MTHLRLPGYNPKDPTEADQVPSGGQLLARFRYDHANRRVARYNPATTSWTYFVHGRDGALLSELTRPATPAGAWVPVRDHVWLDGSPVAH